VALPWQKTTNAASLGGDLLRAVWEHRGDECAVSLSGRVTIDSSPDLRALLLERVNSPDSRFLTVDFYEVPYVDTSGLATLIEVLRAARRQGKTFSLSRLRERPRYLLEATRLLHLFREVNGEIPLVNHSSPENSL
jgi:anti-sigma B factor antagonist